VRTETPLPVSIEADQAETRGYGPMFSPKESSLGTPRIRLKTTASPTLPYAPVYHPFLPGELTVSAPPNFGTKSGAGRGKRTPQSTPRQKSQSVPKKTSDATPRRIYQPPFPRRQTRAMTKRRKVTDDTWEEFDVMFVDDL
jgi:hypothetical protein